MAHDKPFFCIRTRSPVLPVPSADSQPLTELLFGETFRIEGESGGYCRGRLPESDTIAYVAADAVAPETDTASHRVARKLIEVYRAPVLNAAVHLQLPLNGLVRLSGARDTIRYGSGRPGTEAAELAGGGWVAMQGLVPVERASASLEEVAGLLVGAPYLAGGKTWLGCDGAGLIHTVLTACGVPMPRVLDAQLRHLETSGRAVAMPSSCDICLVYAGDSAGFLFQGRDVVAASVADMQVVRQPLGEFLARNAAARFFKSAATPLERGLSGL